jgi:hypothetical protein
MRYRLHTLLAAALVASLAVPAFADWAVMSADTSVKVAKGTMSVKPGSDWNRSSARPSKRSEAWTRDGINLNELTFYGGINDGETFFRSWWSGGERVPRFKKDMLPTDIAELFEASNRQVLQTPVFQMGKIEPAKLGSHDGVRFGYTYAAQNEDIERRGEATAAIVEGRLYLVNFIAPSLHYFDASIGEVRKMIEGVEIIPPKVKVEDGKTKKKKKKSSVIEIMKIEAKK